MASMTRSRSTLVRILLRSSAFVAVLLVGDLVGYLWETPDANIGLGLLIFLAMMVLAFAAAFIDGRRRLPSGVVLWLVVAVVVALATSVHTSLAGWAYSGSFAWPVLLSDLRTGTPFFTLLVSIPAIVGFRLGWVASSGSARSRAAVG